MMPEDLWAVLRTASGGGDRGGCMVWTELAYDVLSELANLNVRGQSSYNEYHFFLATDVPKENVVRVNGERLYDLLQERNHRASTRLLFADAVGKIQGVPGEEAVLDGTAGQFFPFGRVPVSCSTGFYGPEHVAPHELQTVYVNRGRYNPRGSILEQVAAMGTVFDNLAKIA